MLRREIREERRWLKPMSMWSGAQKLGAIVRASIVPSAWKMLCKANAYRARRCLVFEMMSMLYPAVMKWRRLPAEEKELAVSAARENGNERYRRLSM